MSSACAIPDRLAAIKGADLPALPSFHVSLRLPSRALGPAAAALARHVRGGFEQRYG